MLQFTIPTICNYFSASSYMPSPLPYILISHADTDIWSHGAPQAADLTGEKVEDYYEILEELGRSVCEAFDQSAVCIM